MNLGSRQEILGRIREALRVPAPQPHHDGGSSNHHDATVTPAAQAQPQAWLPAVPADVEGRLTLFQKNCFALATDLRVVDDAPSASGVLAELRDAHGWSAVATHHHALLDQLVPALGLETHHTEARPDPATLERCSVGVTACDALVAQTGSILLTARSAGGRALSVLPPHHVVVAEIDQLVPDLPAAFDLLSSRYGDRYPSFTTLITGPSRTGDIERILVLGAHGPRNLTVILIR